MSDDLEQQLDQETQPWMAEPGDKLVGRIVEIGEMESDYGTYPLIIVATETGEEKAFHAFRTVAKQEIARQKPSVGDRIGIKYLGRMPDKNYDGYKIRVVRSDGPPPALDFDKLQADVDRELAAPAPIEEEVPF